MPTLCEKSIRILPDGMCGTAKYVLNHYCTVGRFSDKLYAGVTNENGVEFIELPEF